MRRTDYARIAQLYDQAEERHRIDPDAQLAAQLARTTGPFCVVDVACGTGNYLRVQRRAYPDARIAWHGVDASSAMLAQARSKLDGVRLDEARAEALPFDDESMDILAAAPSGREHPL